MPRPSQNTDAALLDAGLALLPQTGLRDLSVRQLAEAAGVNLGMFHYHFRTKEAFADALLQRLYDRLMADLDAVAAAAHDDPLDRLRDTVMRLARFGVAHRAVLQPLVADALSGDAFLVRFMGKNQFRHVSAVVACVVEAQRAGRIVPMPPPAVVAALASAVAFPILLAASVERHGARYAGLSPAVAPMLAAALEEPAIRGRLELVLRGLAPAPAKPATPARRPTARRTRTPKEDA